MLSHNGHVAFMSLGYPRRRRHEPTPCRATCSRHLHAVAPLAGAGWVKEERARVGDKGGPTCLVVQARWVMFQSSWEAVSGTGRPQASTGS
jgi:hypothetical protein